MGRLRGGPSRTGAQGAYLDRSVTDEQRSSRPIFNATLRAAASWLFFRVARSTRTIQIWALRSRLEKQPTDLRRNSRDLGDGTLAPDRLLRAAEAFFGWAVHPCQIEADLLQIPAYSRVATSQTNSSCLVYPCTQPTWEFHKGEGRIVYCGSLRADRNIALPLAMLISLPVAARTLLDSRL
jgi:hypothetical protein